MGQEFLRVFGERNFKFDDMVLFGSARSAGRTFSFGGKDYVVKELKHNDDFAGVDIAFVSAGGGVSKEFAETITKHGAVMIDNSSAFRMDSDVPLVVPEVNAADALVRPRGIIANPNCTTILLVVVLNPIERLSHIRRVRVSTYQAASGAGKEGLTDLTEKRTYGKLKSFPHPLFDNVIAQIGNVLPSGNTTEENKLRFETGKILHQSSLAVNAFCVRVPVTVGHCAFVNVRLQQSFEIGQIRSLLKNTKDVLLFDDAQQQLFPMPAVLRHTHFVGVGRIFRDDTGKGVNMFVVADNLLRGAAYNAYQILIQCMKNNGDLQ